MIPMNDSTAPLSEAKSRRKELRLKPSVEQAIKRAAGLTGMDESTFIASAAYKMAQEVEAARFSTALSDERFTAFAAAVDAPGTRNDTLAGIMAQSRGLFGDTDA